MGPGADIPVKRREQFKASQCHPTAAARLSLSLLISGFKCIREVVGVRLGT